MRDRCGRWAVVVLAALIATLSIPAVALASPVTYTVQAGDTLWTIAAKFGLAVDAIIAANGLTRPDSLRIGQTLKIPAARNQTRSAPGGTYTVRAGDSLWTIAAAHDTSVAALARLNGLSEEAILRPGQVLRVSGGPAASSRSSAPSPSRPSATYTVQPGDTLWAIARRSGTTPARLADLNGLADDAVLRPGQTLRVPAAPKPAAARAADRAVASTAAAARQSTAVSAAAQPRAPAPAREPARPAFTTYTVQPGDTLWSVARAHGSTPQAIAATTGIDPEATIQPGDTLRIPARGAEPPERPSVRPAARRELPYRGAKWASAVITFATRYMGRPYRWGAEGPSAFDCSGFMNFVFGHFSIRLPRVTFEMFKVGTAVPRDQLKTGDVVFFTTYRPGASHAGIYMGDGRFIHASSARGRVTISSITERYYSARYVGARRY